MKYIIWLQANLSNPTYYTIFCHHPSPLFNTKQKAVPPLSIRIASSLSSLNSNDIPFVTTQFFPVPPWNTKTPTYLFDLATKYHSWNISSFFTINSKQNYLLLWLLLCTGIHAKGASERLLCQREGLGWFERQLVQRYICGPIKM